MAKKKVVRMLRGTLLKRRRKCGRENCHCFTGDRLHESWVLSVSLKGKTRFIPVRDTQLSEVRQWVLAYRRAQQALEREVIKGIQWLRRS